MTTTHELKCWPEPYRAVVAGRKTYEIRKDDRNYQVGDLLLLQEWDPKTERYTIERAYFEITHKTPGGDWGLPADVCVLGIAPVRYSYQSNLGRGLERAERCAKAFAERAGDMGDKEDLYWCNDGDLQDLLGGIWEAQAARPQTQAEVDALQAELKRVDAERIRDGCRLVDIWTIIRRGVPQLRHQAPGIGSGNRNLADDSIRLLELLNQILAKTGMEQ